MTHICCWYDDTSHDIYGYELDPWIDHSDQKFAFPYDERSTWSIDSINFGVGPGMETRRWGPRPRLDRDVWLPVRDETARPSHFSRDRDRDRDVQFGVRDETETETLIGRDRDIFQDLGMISFIALSEVFLRCISFSSKLNKFKNSEVCRDVSLCM